MKSDFAKNIFEEQAQSRLNQLADNIEQFKSANGHYPNNLSELTKYNPTVPVNDPMASVEKGKKIDFYYRNLGSDFSIYSIGKDGVAGTEDDLSPKTANDDIRKSAK